MDFSVTHRLLAVTSKWTQMYLRSVLYIYIFKEEERVEVWKKWEK